MNDILKLSKKQFSERIKDPKDELCQIVNKILYPNKKFEHNLEIPDEEELWGGDGSQPYQCIKCNKHFGICRKKPKGEECEIPDPIEINISELAFLLKKQFSKSSLLGENIKKVMENSFPKKCDDFNYLSYWVCLADEIHWIQAYIWTYLAEKKEEND